MRKSLQVILYLLWAGVAFGQNRTVTGKVSAEEDGSVLPGVNILIKGTTVGTTTDATGSFSLEVPASGASLTFSYVGFLFKEVAVGTQSVLNVSLTSDIKSLSEVVVVGYGVQQKKAFTGSASSIDAKQFSNLVTPSIDKQLAGRATGVQVTNSGGGVNTPARIRVRGVNSINQNNDPLIVVDGIPIISGNLASVGNSNALGDINPSDIESMEILKDGSATAIYGSRAAAGVILITTKRGAKGRAKVTYDGFIGFSSALKKFDVLNASEFVTIANEKLTNAGLAARAGTNASAPSYDTDWQSEVMINNAPAHNHNLSVTGGGDKLNYYLSLNYSDQRGIIINNTNKSYRVRMNLDYEVNKFVKVGNNITLSRQVDTDGNNGSNSLGGAIAASLRLLPNVSPYLESNVTGYNINYPTSGSMTPGPNAQTVDDNFNNVAFTSRANKYSSDKYRIINNSFMEVSPIEGLKLRSQVGVDLFTDYSYQGLNLFHGDGYGTGTNYNASQNQLRLVWSNYFNYNFSLDKHNFFLTGGNEIQKETYKWFSGNGSVLSDAFFIGKNIITGSASTQSIGGNYDERGFTSLFGRLNYDFAGRYFFQATIRRDGQSALAPGNKYGVFPGFSAGWRISEEGFWQGSEGLSRAVSDLKLKASYAKVGNTLGSYPYLSTYGSTPYGNLSGIGPTGVGNPELKWETSAKYDIGIDAGILNNRFHISADWFLNNVDNLVLAVPTPMSAGIPGSQTASGGTISQNIGKLQNKGIELSIGGSILRGKDFTWDANFNYSKVKNKILSLYQSGGAPVPFIDNGVYNIIRVGDPINIIYGYRSAGVNAANGNAMFLKADGTLIQFNTTSEKSRNSFYTAKSATDGTLGDASSLSSSDKVNLGQGVPTWFGAFTNNFGYKGFGLEVMLRYSGGNKIMNYTRQEVLFNQSFQNNGREILERWTTPGQITEVPRLYNGLAANMNTTGNASSRWVESGDYLRLQNIVLSYSFNGSNLSKWTRGYVNNLKVYAQGQNLHVWTKYKGADPDNISSLGVDAAVTPQVRTISFGLSVGF
jgi:TonB-linked SusC/RagA family outer membrane protein